MGGGSQPHAQPETGGSVLHVYVPRRQGVPATSRTLRIHFNRLLQRKEYVRAILLPGQHTGKGTYYYYYYYVSSSSSTMAQSPIIGLDLMNTTYSPLSIHSFNF